MGVFPRFLNCTNDIKSRNASRLALTYSSWASQNMEILAGSMKNMQEYVFTDA